MQTTAKLTQQPLLSAACGVEEVVVHLSPSTLGQ